MCEREIDREREREKERGVIHICIFMCLVESDCLPLTYEFVIFSLVLFNLKQESPLSFCILCATLIPLMLSLSVPLIQCTCFQVECKKAQPKEVMTPTGSSRGRARVMPYGMDAFMLGIGMLGKMIVAALDARTWVKLRKERDVQSKIVSH